MNKTTTISEYLNASKEQIKSMSTLDVMRHCATILRSAEDGAMAMKSFLVGQIGHRGMYETLSAAGVNFLEFIKLLRTKDNEVPMFDPVFGADMLYKMGFNLSVKTSERMEKNSKVLDKLDLVVKKEENGDPIAILPIVNGVFDMQKNTIAQLQANDIAISDNIPKENIVFACGVLSGLYSYKREEYVSALTTLPAYLNLKGVSMDSLNAFRLGVMENFVRPTNDMDGNKHFKHMLNNVSKYPKKTCIFHTSTKSKPSSGVFEGKAAFLMDFISCWASLCKATKASRFIVLGKGKMDIIIDHLGLAIPNMIGNKYVCPTDTKGVRLSNIDFFGALHILDDCRKFRGNDRGSKGEIHRSYYLGFQAPQEVVDEVVFITEWKQAIEEILKKTQHKRVVVKSLSGPRLGYLLSSGLVQSNWTFVGNYDKVSIEMIKRYAPDSKVALADKFKDCLIIDFTDEKLSTSEFVSKKNDDRQFPTAAFTARKESFETVYEGCDIIMMMPVRSGYGDAEQFYDNMCKHRLLTCWSNLKFDNHIGNFEHYYKTSAYVNIARSFFWFTKYHVSNFWYGTHRIRKPVGVGVSMKNAKARIEVLDEILTTLETRETYNGEELESLGDARTTRENNKNDDDDDDEENGDSSDNEEDEDPEVLRPNRRLPVESANDGSKDDNDKPVRDKSKNRNTTPTDLVVEEDFL